MSRRKRGGPLPIILGGGHLRKGLMVFRWPGIGGADLAVAELNRECRSGERFDRKDIQSIRAVLHFCDESAVDHMERSLEAVRQTIRDGEVPEQDDTT